jgi:hypothetical protein
MKQLLFLALMVFAANFALSQDTIRPKELLFFSNDGCGKCQTAQLYFESHAMPFTKYPVKENRTLMYEYVHRKTGGKNVGVGYPVLVYGDSIYFSIKNMNSVLMEIEQMMKSDGLLKDDHETN